MAAIGESKARKTMSAPRVLHIERKQTKYIARVSRGPHTAETSIPLVVAIRNNLKLADNAKEVRAMLNEGKVLVDGKINKDLNFPLGFMDVLAFPSVNKYYRIRFDDKGRLVPKEIDAKTSTFKLCRIQNRTVIKGGKIQLNLHDGKNILYDKKVATGDVLKLELPSLHVLEYYPMTEGSVAYVTGGKHAGQVARIKNITTGTMMRKPLALLDKGDSAFETRKDYVFVLGVKEPAIKID